MAAFSPHKFQQMALDELCRYVLAIAGAQGGKTTLGAIWLLVLIQANANKGKFGDYLICAPTVKILNQSTMVKFLSVFPPDWGEWKEQKQCFELCKALGSAKIFVRSADDPNHLEGMTLLGAWLDEFGQMVQQVWINIQARLAVMKGHCMMTTTPYLNYFWVKDQVYAKACKINNVPTTSPDTDSEIAVVEWESADNPGFPPEEIERQRKLLSKETFDLRYRGKFARPQGLVYSEFDFENDVVKPFPIPNDWVKFGGMDFGFGSKTAALGIAKKPEVRNPETKEIIEPAIYYIFREFYKKGAMLQEAASALDLMQLKYILGDPRGAQEIAELQRLGVKIYQADNTVDIGIERIKVLIAEHRLKIFSSCVNVLSELQSYHYKIDVDNKENDGKPAKVYDHAMDALKYAFSRNMEGIYKERRSSVKFQMRKRLGPDGFTRGMIKAHTDSITGYA